MAFRVNVLHYFKTTRVTNHVTMRVFLKSTSLRFGNNFVIYQNEPSGEKIVFFFFFFKAVSNSKSKPNSKSHRPAVSIFYRGHPPISFSEIKT